MRLVLNRVCKPSVRLVAAVLALCASASPMSVLAQNDAQLTQYWAVPSYYNPAATGLTDFVTIRAGGKLQWLGIENAPRTFFVTADTPFKLGKKHRFGVGVVANGERIGLYNNMSVGVQVSYKFKFLKGTWSVGLQPGFYNTKFRGSDVYIPEGDDYHEPGDQYLPTTDVSGNAFDLGAGVSYSHKYFNVGVSCLHLMQPKITLGNEGGGGSESIEFETEVPRQLYFTVDSNIPLKNTLFSLQPSLLVRTDFTRWTGEVTMRATYNRFITFGVGYRYKEGVNAMVGATFKNFFVGYAYDYPLSSIGKSSSGSHELVAGYQIKLNLGDKNRNKHRSIRIM